MFVITSCTHQPIHRARSFNLNLDSSAERDILQRTLKNQTKVMMHAHCLRGRAKGKDRKTYNWLAILGSRTLNLYNSILNISLYCFDPPTKPQVGITFRRFNLYQEHPCRLLNFCQSTSIEIIIVSTEY
jgi:hypothetical protein